MGNQEVWDENHKLVEAFIREFYWEYWVGPTQTEIEFGTGLSSVPIMRHIKALEKEGKVLVLKAPDGRRTPRGLVPASPDDPPLRKPGVLRERQERERKTASR